MTATPAAAPLRDTALDTPAAWRLGVLAYDGWLSANDNRAGRLHFKRAKIIAVWRQAARDRAVKTKVPPLGPVRIIAECCFLDRRKRDPANYVDTAKAAVDGLVDAGVLEDDSAAHVIGPDMRLGPVQGGMFGLLVLHLYPLGGAGVAP